MMQLGGKSITNEKLKTLNINQKRFETDPLVKTQRKHGTQEFTLFIKFAKSLMKHRISNHNFMTLKSYKDF